VRLSLRVLLLAAALAAATWAFGWWSVPVVAAIWGWIAASLRRPVLVAAAAAAGSWAALLAWTWAASAGAASSLGASLGAVMQLPPFALIALTLAFPALLAACAAQLAVAARRQFI
jgi:hypothetical protein